MGMLVALTLTLLVTVILYFALKMNSNQALAGLISGCVTYISSLFAIFMIIVKYIFPEDEEKNFNDLIATIIKDDTNRIKNQYDFFSKGNDNDKNCKLYLPYGLPIFKLNKTGIYLAACVNSILREALRWIYYEV